MLEINAQNFMAAVVEMRRVRSIMDTIGGDHDDWKAVITMEQRPIISTQVDGIVEAVGNLYARAANIAAGRLKQQLAENDGFTWRDLGDAMKDIESRLHDELSLVRLFVMNEQEAVYLQPGHQLLGQNIADRYPSIIFEMEESAKCLALSRPTASAFHSMRALEVMIAALRKFLGITESEKPAERSWAIVLKAIKEAMDAKYPAKARKAGSEGAQVEALHATLDAIKNPWRNATMHVEQIYQPYEASHILQSVNVFALKMAALCDENGVPDDLREILG